MALEFGHFSSQACLAISRSDKRYKVKTSLERKSFNSKMGEHCESFFINHRAHRDHREGQDLIRRMPSFSNLTLKLISKPGPNPRCTSMAAPMITRRLKNRSL